MRLKKDEVYRMEFNDRIGWRLSQFQLPEYSTIDGLRLHVKRCFISSGRKGYRIAVYRDGKRVRVVK